MTDFTLATTVREPFDAVLAQVRQRLADAGFGVLTEIDLAGTLRAKLGVDRRPHVILGACRPELANQGLDADERVAALLPCNVVVSEHPEGTRVEVFDPAVMTTLSDAPGIAEVARDAAERLSGMLRSLEQAHAAGA
ncbi:MAG: DUF302 domain-containing protein [Frankiaceae bacterium]|nr:DUF302 domain-containing protein [Frankiaceae bacterium]